MGRTTPDGPRGYRPNPPPAPPSRRPDFNPPGQGGTSTPRRARCEYCRRGGVELTQCEGCGATVPAASSPGARPTFPANRVIRGAAIVPAFPMVKR
jgi:hypothetical protein